MTLIVSRTVRWYLPVRLLLMVILVPGPTFQKPMQGSGSVSLRALSIDLIHDTCTGDWFSFPLSLEKCPRR